MIADGEMCMDDFISRKAAKRIVDDINTWSSGWRDYAKLQIDAIPAADVREVVRGHWIKPKNEMEFRCSICNADMKYPSRYCPHCGASMEVKHD